MNNPTNEVIDIEEQRAWLVEHMALNGKVWRDIARNTGTKVGTISQFGRGNYAGDNLKLAQAVYRYRQKLAMQAELKSDLPEAPPYYKTRTSEDLISLLTWAHARRMVLFVGGPGVGKSITAQHYAGSLPNVFVVRVYPSTQTVRQLCSAVLIAMKDFGVRNHNALPAYTLSQIRERCDLLIFDEAQHLTIDQIEEIRGWFDEGETGIAILGNETVASRMDGGSRQAEYAQIYSRLARKIMRPIPLAEDIEACADEWRISDPATMKVMHRIGTKPGGLRGLTFALELAGLLAKGDGGEMTAQHLSDAWSQISMRSLS